MSQQPLSDERLAQLEREHSKMDHYHSEDILELIAEIRRLRREDCDHPNRRPITSRVGQVEVGAGDWVCEDCGKMVPPQ